MLTGCALTQLCRNRKLTECVLHLTPQNFLHNPFFSLGLYLHAYRVLGASDQCMKERDGLHCNIKIIYTSQGGEARQS